MHTQTQTHWQRRRLRRWHRNDFGREAKEEAVKMENLAKRNNVTFDGNQQNIDSRVSKLCSTILLWSTICVLFFLSLFVCMVNRLQ